MTLKKFLRDYIFLIIATILMAFFIVWTILVKFVDVSKIGPEGSSVGLATFNKTFLDLISSNETLIKITSILMVVPIVLAGVLVVIGVIQLIKRKHLLKVDHEILFLGIFLIILIGLYFLFEIIIVNYRPILEDGKLEASYPSSHALICTFIYLSSMIVLNKLIPNKNIKLITFILIAILLLVSVVGRLLSGAHWISDIIGGILLSTSLYFFYLFICVYVNKKISINVNKQNADI